MKLSADKLPRPVRSAYSWVKAVLAEYTDDNGGIVAAAISFYTFISLIPLALVGVSILGFVLGGQEQSRALIMDSVRKAAPGPAAETIQRLIGGIIAGRAPAGIIGILLLLWSGSSVFVNLENALNIAWDSEKRRGFFKDRALAVGVLIATGLLLLISFGLTTGANLLQRQELFGFNLRNVPFIWELLAYLLPPLVSIAMFTLIYKLLPTVEVSWKAALVGGVTAGIIWEILKLAFTYYLTNFANFGAIYGSLATVIVLIIWIFYSSIITVLGAEVSQVYGRRTEQAEGRKEERPQKAA